MSKNISELIKTIEAESEEKIIKGYKSGDIKLPKLSEDGEILEVDVKDADKQANYVKNIMAESAKKFESATGRRLTYSEIREAFG
jgi:hypothetical protein